MPARFRIGNRGSNISAKEPISAFLCITTMQHQDAASRKWQRISSGNQTISSARPCHQANHVTRMSQPKDHDAMATHDQAAHS
jgi:hypothetical protein